MTMFDEGHPVKTPVHERDEDDNQQNTFEGDDTMQGGTLTDEFMKIKKDPRDANIQKLETSNKVKLLQNVN
jgi:hypothetical protein